MERQRYKFTVRTPVLVETWTVEPLEIPELDKIKLPDWMTVEKYTPLQQVEVETLVNKNVWVTARREQVPVQQMTTSHINNCIACFNGEGRVKIPSTYLGGKDKWIRIFNTELLTRQ